MKFEVTQFFLIINLIIMYINMCYTSQICTCVTHQTIRHNFVITLNTICNIDPIIITLHNHAKHTWEKKKQ